MAKVHNIHQLSQEHYDSLGYVMYERGYPVSPSHPPSQEMIAEAVSTYGDELLFEIAEIEEREIEVGPDFFLSASSASGFPSFAPDLSIYGMGKKASEISWKDALLVILGIAVAYLLFFNGD